MNSKTLNKLDNINILKDNQINTNIIYDAYIIIDESLKDNEIKEAIDLQKTYKLTEQEEEKIKVEQALWHLAQHTDKLIKEDYMIIQKYINKLEEKANNNEQIQK